MPFLPLPPAKLKAGMDEDARHRRLSGEKLPAPKNGSEALKEIVLKACAYDPKDRYQSAQEMLDALNTLNTGPVPLAEQIVVPLTHSTPATEMVQDDDLTVGPSWPSKPEPIDDDLTVGPTWKNKPAETNTDITVGPVFVKASASADVPKKPEVSKKMSTALLGAAAAAIVILVLLISLIGGNTKNNQVPAASAPSNQQAAVSNQSTQNSVCSHVWNNATCTQPKTCRDCGETQGAAAGHSWVDATRLSPKTCSVCGATEGTALAPPNISVDSQVQQIADEYYAIEDALNNGDLNRKDVRSGVYYYYDKYGNIRSVVTAKGNDGLGSYSDQYRRYYYFANGELIFVFFEGQDCHRLYFYKGQLMRWRYQGVGQSIAGAVNEDFTYSDDFLKWESLALKEVAGFGVI